MKLRPYQDGAVAGVLDRFRAGDRSTLLELPTGCGKTIVFAELARMGIARGRRVLVLAHRTELLSQAADKLRAVGLEPAIEQGSSRAGDARVVVASVQTLKGARLAAWPVGAFDLIVIDEAHHATAATYVAVLSHFATAKVLGVTATPDRGDGQGVGKVFESVAFRYPMRAAIRDGWLAPIRARRVVVDGVDLGAVHTRAGDLDRGELGLVMSAEKALHGVVVPLLEMAGERRTIVFAVDVAHARGLADRINGYRSGAARAVDGSAKADDRAATLADFRAGAFQFLVNCALYTEGFDEPTIAAVAIARPTKSRGLYTQMIGRGTRLAPAKADCLVLDFTATAGRHRLIGPVDALAGRDVPDDVRAAAAAMLGDGQLELDAVLDAAESIAAESREIAKVTAVAKYRAEVIDPFLGDMPASASVGWSTTPATHAQLEALNRTGLEKLPAGLTKSEASRWLDMLERRRMAGLATVRQVRLLSRYRVEGLRDVTFDQARELISKLERGGWRPRALNEADESAVWSGNAA